MMGYLIQSLYIIGISGGETNAVLLSASADPVISMFGGRPRMRKLVYMGHLHHSKLFFQVFAF